MRHLSSRFSGLRRAVCGFACCGVGVAGAESGASASAEAATETRPPIFARPHATEDGEASAGADSGPARTPRRRASSPELAAKIFSVIVRPPLREGELRPADGAMVPLPVEDTEVVRLERYVVRERRVPDFKDRDILTVKGKAALARRRYPGAGAAALAMLEEDFANERRQEAAEFIELLELAGTELSGEVKRLMKDASLRRGEFAPAIGRPK